MPAGLDVGIGLSHVVASAVARDQELRPCGVGSRAGPTGCQDRDHAGRRRPVAETTAGRSAGACRCAVNVLVRVLQLTESCSGRRTPHPWTPLPGLRAPAARRLETWPRPPQFRIHDSFAGRNFACTTPLRAAARVFSKAVNRGQPPPGLSWSVASTIAGAFCIVWDARPADDR